MVWILAKVNKLVSNDNSNKILMLRFAFAAALECGPRPGREASRIHTRWNKPPDRQVRFHHLDTLTGSFTGIVTDRRRQV